MKRDVSDIDKNPSGEDESKSLDFLSDVALQLRVILGRTQLTIADLIKLKKGSVIVLEDVEKDTGVEILANGNSVAKGEVVVVNDSYGVRVTSIKDPES